jgi:hypothetical protein
MEVLMLSGDFERKLHKLNRNLHIFCGDNDARAAGIFVVSPRGEYTEICGIDKSFIPQYVIYSEDGRIFKTGWRRALKILIGKGLINRKTAEKEFCTHLTGRAPTRPQIKQDSLLKKLDDIGVKLINTGSC